MTRPTTLFKVSSWDAIPAALAVIQLALVWTLYAAWPGLSWGARAGALALYAFSVGWNLNSIAHNFIHNPFFRSERANRLMSLTISLALLSPQTMYRYVHLKHHAGNADRPDATGATVDPLSIYQHGHDGKPEPMLSYVFLEFFRGDSPFELARRIGEKRPKEAQAALFEFWAVIGVYGAALAVGLFTGRWAFTPAVVVGSYLGQCLSNLNGYYEHLGGNPDKPIAWGVSTYGRLYNWVFLYNGYHAEHHYRPKIHWTKMVAFHRQIAAEQVREGVTVIRRAHFLGFLDPQTSRIETARRPKAAS
ncbi:fatty acid desaturase [Phenylobacterium sp.]|jgi:fatty acid desaturase|uniref:fatty acid desaturase family protein n=1 Tax=Phenylobacterium sp. TaxID=1871053 RepID=UPI002E378E93|nr:fatty acid desaturase [Phenylobacterium sp.]HEX3363728.1 fatty acid desaturase [Phenylobacterium sp.]